MKYNKIKNNPYSIVKMFEDEVSNYTGAKYAISVDNCTNAIFLVCKYLNVQEVTIPSKTYLSVPQSIIHAGGTVIFDKSEDVNNWKGIYQLNPYPIFDAAKRFTSDMYIPGAFMCLSFHIKKHLKIGKGGMILTDNEEAANWFKKARYEGRSEKLYHEDDIDMLGWNMYMTPQQASVGLALMQNYPTTCDDLDENNGYRDLTEFTIFKNCKVINDKTEIQKEEINEDIFFLKNKVCFVLDSHYKNYTERLKTTSLKTYMELELFNHGIDFIITTNNPNEFSEYKNEHIKVFYIDDIRKDYPTSFQYEHLPENPYGLYPGKFPWNIERFALKKAGELGYNYVINLDSDVVINKNHTADSLKQLLKNIYEENTVATNQALFRYTPESTSEVFYLHKKYIEHFGLNYSNEQYTSCDGPVVIYMGKTSNDILRFFNIWNDYTEFGYKKEFGFGYDSVVCGNWSLSIPTSDFKLKWVDLPFVPHHVYTDRYLMEKNDLKFSIQKSELCDKGFYFNSISTPSKNEEKTLQIYNNHMKGIESYIVSSIDDIFSDEIEIYLGLFKKSLDNNYDSVIIFKNDVTIFNHDEFQNDSKSVENFYFNLKKNIDVLEWDILLFKEKENNTNNGEILIEKVKETSEANSFLINKRTYNFILENFKTICDSSNIFEIFNKLSTYGFNVYNVIKTKKNSDLSITTKPIVFEDNATIVIVGHFVNNFLFYLNYLVYSLPNILRKCKFLIIYDTNKNISGLDNKNLLEEYFKETPFNYEIIYSTGGLVDSVRIMLENLKTEYFIFLEHDWIFLDKNEINFQGLIESFNKYNFIHAVWFNKDDNTMRGFEIAGDIDGNETPYGNEPRVTDFKLTTTIRWSNNPAMFRTSKFKEWYDKYIDNPTIGVNHQGQYNVEDSMIREYRDLIARTRFSDIRDDWGTYLYGHVGDGPYVGHTDGSRRYQTSIRTMAEDNADEYVKKNPLPNNRFTNNISINNMIEEKESINTTLKENSGTLSLIYKKYFCQKHYNGFSQIMEPFLNSISNNNPNILEIGIGTVSLDPPHGMTHVPANMYSWKIDNPSYQPGNCLRVLKEFLNTGNIYGVDIQSDCIINEDRIHTYIFDSRSPIKSSEFISEKKFELIIDDSDKDVNVRILTFNNFFNSLSDSGYYVIEGLLNKPLLDEFFNHNNISHIVIGDFIIINKKNNFNFFLEKEINPTTQVQNIVKSKEKNIINLNAASNTSIPSSTFNWFLGQLSLGSWEKENFKIFDDCADIDSCALDIGSWIGPMSIYMSRIFKKVISIEPDRMALESLKNNLLDNGCSNVDIIDKAIHSENKKIIFGSNKEVSGSGLGDSMSQVKVTPTNKNDYEVDTVTIKEIVESYKNEKISFVKVDIEGGEENIIEDLFIYGHEFGWKMLISFHYTWWNEMNINKIEKYLPYLKRITISGKEIDITSFCSNIENNHFADVYLEFFKKGEKNNFNPIEFVNTESDFKINGLTFADRGFFINLPNSTDRLKLVIEQIDKYEIEGLNRFEALTDEWRHASCTKSHITLFRECLKQNFETIFVAEDDFMIEDYCYYPIGQNQKFFDVISKVHEDLKNVDWDVLLFGCNPKAPLIPITNNLAVVNRSTGAWAYLIKKNAYTYLINNSNYKRDVTAIDDWLPILNDKGFVTLTTIPLSINHGVGLISTLQPSTPVNYDGWIKGSYHAHLYDIFEKTDFFKKKIENELTIVIVGKFVDNFLFHLNYLFHSLPNRLKKCKILVNYYDIPTNDLGYKKLSLEAFFKDVRHSMNTTINYIDNISINSFNKILDKVKTPYILLLEHDWVFLKNDNINFDCLIETFQKNDFVNNVWFSKYPNVLNDYYVNENSDGTLTPFDVEDRIVDCDLLTTSRWSTNPGVFRVSKLKENLNKVIELNPDGTVFDIGEEIYKLFKEDIKLLGWQKVKDIWGTYLYGKMGDLPYVGFTNSNKKTDNTHKTYPEINADIYIGNNPLL